jgi:outer membrane lipoprotein SlyB
MNPRIVCGPSRLAAGAALTAILAATTLTACGPSDGQAATASRSAADARPASPALSAQGTAVPLSPPPVVERAGTPVPLVADAGRPATRETAPLPSSPQPSPLPAQSADLVAPPTGYTAPTTHVAPAPAVAPRPVDRSRIGSITGIEPIRERPPGTGVGAVVGGVLGAVVGNQFGHGTGRAAMTGAGAVGGAIAGNNVERNQRKAIVGYRVAVRLDNGTVRSYRRSGIGNLHVGDRVRIDGGSFRRL